MRKNRSTLLSRIAVLEETATAAERQEDFRSAFFLRVNIERLFLQLYAKRRPAHDR